MSASVTLTDFSSVNPQVIRLRENLNTCSTYILSDNVEKSQESVNSLVEFLDSFYNLNLIESEEDDNTVPNQIRINSINPEEDENVQVLHDLLRFLTSSSLNQMVVDVLALRLPGVVAKLGCVSDKCREISECLIDRLVSTCNPRDMLSILCEVMLVFTKTIKHISK
ncbi:hypothetical protein GIB67_021712 [Kingdonia uniflora]|uniref:Uncharacterized protein n=1 Tax=Kingdonia uniflora TaxID=39325 RepID=A0A7J7LMB6_9MAGN|nr:hypothetical protein GIB67_021712 [Kingdonia uniflora]